MGGAAVACGAESLRVWLPGIQATEPCHGQVAKRWACLSDVV